MIIPDISMCHGENCEMKEICYRYKAKPNEYMQTYFVESPCEGLFCEYFWEYKTDNDETNS
jgi:hypothetical protein